MEISVLGPVQVTARGRAVDARNGKELILLAVLGLSAGRPVPAGTLAERLWDGSPPPRYRSTLYTYITRARRRLEQAGAERSLLSQTPGGYVLHVAEEKVDWHRFTTLRTRASVLAQAGDGRAAVELLDEALRAWRGEPLTGVRGTWARDMRVAMGQAHQDVLGEWAHLALESGRDGEVVQVLDQALTRYPLNEALVRHSMHALHLAGRAADALRLYQRLRERLAEELGADPGPQVQRVHRQILRGRGPDPAPPRTPAAQPPPKQESSVGVRDNLGRDLSDFSGRESLCAAVTTALTSSDRNAARVCAVTGMPGVGKSALALHVAHRVAPSFPDARLYLDLRGHNEHLPPLTPAEALAQLLQLLGVSPEEIPASVEQRTALWRDRAWRMRALVILDDAADAQQVEPLLPGGAGCAVVVTSRRLLPELDGARHIEVEAPPLEEAVAMFTAISGGRARGQEADQVPVIVELCDRLPLAMRLVGVRLRLRPSLPLADMVRRIRATSRRLAEFRAGKRHLEAVFAVSLRSLSPAGQEAFVRLGLHPMPILDAVIASELTGQDHTGAEAALEELVDAHLLQEPRPGRYRFHSLVLAFAHQRAEAVLPAAEQRSVRERMLDAYTGMCRAADAVLYPHRLRSAPPPRASTGPLREEWGLREAAAWLRTEIPTLLAIVDYAADHGYTEQVAHLSHLLAEYLDDNGPWEAALRLHRRAVHWWLHCQDRRFLAQSWYELARAHLRLGELEEAEACLERARICWRAVGDALGESWALAQHGRVHYVAGRYEQALECQQRALGCFREEGHRSGTAFALHLRGLGHMAVGAHHRAIADYGEALQILTDARDANTEITVKANLAGSFQKLGYHREATALCEETLLLVQELGDQRREAAIWNNLGNIFLYKNNSERAIASFQHALRIHRTTIDPWTEAMTLASMGNAHLGLGRADRALDCFRQSLGISERYANPTAEVEARLGIGESHRLLGQRLQALECFQRAVTAARRHRLRQEQGQALYALGRLLLDRGNRPGAVEHLTEAHAIFAELKVPEAQTVHLVLDNIDNLQPSTPG